MPACFSSTLPAFHPQGALIALAMVLMEQPASKTETLRAKIDKLHGNKGVEVRGGGGWLGPQGHALARRVLCLGALACEG